jgi:hypothetical protein
MKKTQTIRYQDCQPLKEQLSDQPNKIAIFFFRGSYGTVGKTASQSGVHLGKQDHKYGLHI